MKYERDWLADCYRQMVVIRRFEERLQKLHSEGFVRGSLHLCIGQEATAVGACAAVTKDDYMTCTYRGHGQCLAKGLSVRAAMAELLGRETGCCKGRGGSMHLTDVSIGLLGENGIVAAGMPIAMGAAFTAKHKGTQQVALSFFGEGATNQGVFHETINLAAAWKLPVIFFCENNLYAEMTPITQEVAVEKMTARAIGNGMRAVEVDGNDVIAVYECVKEAVALARAGEGPTFIEAHTYRFAGHMVGDPEVYRTKAEVEERRKRDPILVQAERMRKKHKFTDDDINKLDDEAMQIVDDAEQFAKDSPFPAAETALENIYA
jgi:pyruvate dehydrogenase E1 component alpha subunit